MSVSPAQNFSKPPPVPEVPTVIFTPGFSAWKASWAACANGATVLDPSILMLPESSSPLLALALPLSSSSSPQAAAPRARAQQAAKVMSVFMRGTLAGSERESVIQLCPSCEKDVKAAGAERVSPTTGGNRIRNGCGCTRGPG